MLKWNADASAQLSTSDADGYDFPSKIGSEEVLTLEK